MSQLGYVAGERFKGARQAGETQQMLAEHWNAALEADQDALQNFPLEAIHELAITHHLLGAIYAQVLPAYLEQAIAHSREAIHFFEAASDLYGAAEARYNIAIAYIWA